MRSGWAWGTGLGVSLVAHAGFFAAFQLTVDPDPVQPQSNPTTAINFQGYEVDRQDATEREPESDSATAAETKGAPVNTGAVRQSRAAPIAATPQAIKAAPAIGPKLEARLEAAPKLGATALDTDVARPASAVSGTAITAQTMPSQSTPPLPPPVDALQGLEVAAAPVTASLVPASIAAKTPVKQETRLVSKSPERPNPQQFVAPTTEQAPPARPQSDIAAAAAPTADTAKPFAPAGQITPSQELPQEAGVATLAWAFNDRIVTDPSSLKTIQAFLAPDELINAESNAGRVKDDLAQVLGGVDCARLSARFIPEDGSLELRGHVPDPSMRANVLLAMQQQVGEDIRVTEKLLHLPAPQCGALKGIADVGLPQSTDQITNKRLVGADTHVREFRYTEGQRLQFDLVAPDYDAFVYVDYFDAEGQVIHLVPNEFIELELHGAKSAVTIGGDQQGKPGLNITIGPPYGQEIAVAFASSVPLFETPRPLVEPGDAYLVALKAKIAEARLETPDFKGEWVYFFISTAPATQ